MYMCPLGNFNEREKLINIFKSTLLKILSNVPKVGASKFHGLMEGPGFMKVEKR
jgi:hypothetical protein